jgi:outer membrane receptor protein involved in Fe transport
MSLSPSAGGRSRDRWPAICLSCLLFTGAAAFASESPRSDAEEEPRVEVRETLTVTDTRLRDRPGERRRIPAHTTVIAGEALRATAADTLQELVAGEAGVVSYDQVGNDLSRVLDLRGFAGGGLKVFLDGVPLNEPRNNTLQLELVPLAALDRVEITRGSSAAQAGGGAEAGVINLFTRRAEGRGGWLSVAAGDLDTSDLGGAAWSGSERADLFASASRFETDGHRDNGASDLTRSAVVAGLALAGDGRLQLSLLHGDGDFGNPGALTGSELAADREQAPFNALDFSEERSLQAVLGFQDFFEGGLSLTANLYRRERQADLLTTGRSAPSFGGFFTDSETSLTGTTLQTTRAWGGRHELTAGLEWLDGETEARGVSTSPDDPGRVAPANLSSDNVAERRTAALYFQESWSPTAAWTVSVGARYDDDEIGYRESFPDPNLDAERAFSELSLRAGVVWAPAASGELYAAYGEAFLPPTVEDLFSFPGFGSNPLLEPEDSTSLEVGLRRRWGRVDLDAALFRIDTKDEIVFDPNSPLSPFGANVNAGGARREGLELVATARPVPGVRLHAGLTLTAAEFTSGENRGSTVPQVPDERLSLGVDLDLPAGFDLGGRVLHVGEQVLANDDANTQAPLADYTVLDARLTWESERRVRGPRLFVEVSNLLDEAYSTRGIYAFDFSTFQNDVFYTPAPGRRVTGGVEWRF